MESLLRPDQTHRLLASGCCRVEQVPLEHHVVLRVDWDHNAGESDPWLLWIDST